MVMPCDLRNQGSYQESAVWYFYIAIVEIRVAKVLIIFQISSILVVKVGLQCFQVNFKPH